MKTYFKLTLSMLLLLGLTVSMTAQDEQYGQASYYSDAYHGKKTASGTKYDKNKLTCAHNDYAYGTKLKVTHLENKKSVIVEVIDRGPYIKGRIVDLSRAAAKKIGLIQDGIAQVKVELVNSNSTTLTSKGDETPKSYSNPPQSRQSFEANIKKENSRAANAAPATNPKGSTASKSKAPAKTAAAPTKAKQESATKAKKETAAKATPAPKMAAKGKAAKKALPMMNGKDFKNADLYQISILKPKKEGFGVQVASFSDYDGVLKKVTELQGQWFTNILIATEKVDRGNDVYKIILGQFETREQANAYKKDLKKNKKIAGFVVSLEK